MATEGRGGPNLVKVTNCRLLSGRFSKMLEQVAIRFLLPSDSTFQIAIPRIIHQSLNFGQ